MMMTVTGAPDNPHATLELGDARYPAMVGRNGLLTPGTAPVEGDGATPTGVHRLLTVYYRPDREDPPRTALPLAPIRPDDLWCDDPAHALYNRPVRAPFAARHEKMWRADRAYDLCVVLDFNLTKPVPSRGSAIFFHLTKKDQDPGPTEGCVAVAPHVMRSLLRQLGRGPQMTVQLAL